jgi:hypothetical protein
MRRFRPRTWVSAVAATGTFGGLLSLALILLQATSLALGAVAVTTVVICAEYFAWSDAFTRDG